MLTSNQEIASAKAIIGRLLSGFLSAQSAITRSTVDAYIDAVRECSLEAIESAYWAIVDGRVSVGGDYSALKTYDPAYPITHLQFGAVVRQHQRALDFKNRPAGTLNDGTKVYRIGDKLPEGTVPLGPTKIDFGGGSIDMSWMSPEEKRRVLASNGKDIPKREESRALVA